MGRAPEGAPSPGLALETGERIRIAVVAPVDVAAVVADPAQRTDRVGLGAAGGADGGGSGHQEGEQAQGDLAHGVLPPKRTLRSIQGSIIAYGAKSGCVYPGRRPGASRWTPGLIDALSAGVRIGHTDCLAAVDAAVLADDAERTDLRVGAAGGPEGGGGGQEQG